MADFRTFLQEGTLPERKALIRSFLKGIDDAVAGLCDLRARS